MMVFPVAESSIKMSLKYNGKGVDDGTMPIDEVVIALQGFAGAYGKVASSVLPQSSHEIRVSAFNEGSFDVHIVGWITSHEGQETLKALGAIGGAASTVFGLVKGYIELKKHVKAKPYQVSVTGSNNTVIVINSEGDGKEASKEGLKLLQSKLIDPDLAKIVRPLEEGVVDVTTITATDEEDVPTVIFSSDKASFALNASEETFQDATLRGKLVSNNSESRKGVFASSGGDRVPYHYTGEHPELFQATYGSAGTVRVSGRAFFDENLKLKRIDITSAVKIQQELGFTPTAPQAPQ